MDYMHCMYLGWLQYFFGSVFQLLTTECLLGEQLDHLLVIAKKIVEFQRTNETKHKYKPKLSKVSMFQKQKLPKTQRKSL